MRQLHFSKARSYAAGGEVEITDFGSLNLIDGYLILEFEFDQGQLDRQGRDFPARTSYGFALIRCRPSGIRFAALVRFVRARPQRLCYCGAGRRTLPVPETACPMALGQYRP